MQGVVTGISLLNAVTHVVIAPTSSRTFETGLRNEIDNSAPQVGKDDQKELNGSEIFIEQRSMAN